ncbi:membrane-spanning 4-domains subfamily A member 4D-like [Rhinophrynus dorsalis]
MTTFRSDAGSFVVISQGTPQSAQADTTTEGPSSKSMVPKSLVKFYKGEPLALGVTQLFIGIFNITLGIVVTASHYERYRHFDLLIYTGLPFWSGIMYTISGSLSIVASCKPGLRKTLERGMMILVFIFTILELCITISTSAFACKVVCQTSFTETSVVIYQSAAVNAGNTAAPVSTITLPSDDDIKNQ